MKVRPSETETDDMSALIPKLDCFEPPPYWDRLKQCIQLGEHVMLAGPRGSGKTYAVTATAEHFGVPLHRIQGHTDMCVEEMRGTPTLADGSSSFCEGPAATAARHGHFLLIDEANLPRSGITAWMNNVLDVPGVLSLPEKGEVIKVAEGFLAFFCFNSCPYAGTRRMNEALTDRCRVIDCEYWPPETEAKMLTRHLSRLAPVDLDRMVTTAEGIRAARREGKTDFDFSMRTLVQWGKHADAFTQDLLTSFEIVVLPKVGDPFEFGLQRQALLELAKLTLS